MNRFFAAIAIAVLAAGCHGQQPPSPPVVTCPTAYTEVNPPSSTSVPASITGTTTTDTPGVGTWVYAVQSWGVPIVNGVATPPYQTSLSSNIVQVTTTTALPVVDLSWTPPAVTGTYASYTYILSRASCSTVGVPLAPTQNQPTTVVMLEKSAPSNLTAIARR